MHRFRLALHLPGPMLSKGHLCFQWASLSQKGSKPRLLGFLWGFFFWIPWAGVSKKKTGCNPGPEPLARLFCSNIRWRFLVYLMVFFLIYQGNPSISPKKDGSFRLVLYKDGNGLALFLAPFKFRGPGFPKLPWGGAGVSLVEKGQADSPIPR